MATNCTPEQRTLVEEILRMEATDYYRVLRVEKTAGDVEIKKSYRKLAIKLHPDKNTHPKASEAFKVIAKAFEVLGDSGKRKLYDMTGRDPDSRGSSAPQNPFRNGPRGAQGFGGQEGFPAEDIFNMFFGGGGPAGFGNGGFQTFQFGNGGFPANGFYFTPGGPQFGGRMPRQQQHAGANTRRRATGQQEPPQPVWLSYLSQYLPIVLILLSLAVSLLTGDSSDDKIPKRFSGRVPRYAFEKKVPFVVERTTPMHSIPYYISEGTNSDFASRKNSESQLRGLDRYVEGKFVESLETGCYIERQKQESMFNDAYGLFFNDNELIQRAKNMEMPHCAKLQKLNAGGLL